MQSSKQGIEINKAELGALLYYAGGATHDGVIKFRTRGKQLFACASDGKRAVEVTAKNDDLEKGEWAVPATYLETLRRGINKGKTEALLRVTRGGLKEAWLMVAGSHDKQITIEDATRGTSTQLSFEAVHDMLDDPQLGGSWFAIQPGKIARALDAISRATEGCPVTIYPPRGPEDNFRFEAKGEGGRWRGTAPTAAVQGPGDVAEVEDDEEEDAGASEPELPFTKKPGTDDDGIVDDDYDPDAEPKKTRGGRMHYIGEGGGPVCGGRVGTSVGSGGTTSLAHVTCAKCLDVAHGKAGESVAGKPKRAPKAAKKPSKKARKG